MKKNQKKNWVPYVQRYIVPSFVDFGPIVQHGEDIFFNSIWVFLLFHNNPLWLRGVVLDLNKLESSSLWNVTCQVWLKLAQGFCSKYFRVQVFFLLVFRYFLPLVKDGAFPLNNHEFLSLRMLGAKFGWN